KDGRKKLVLWNGTVICDELGASIGKLAVGFEISRFDRRLADVGASAGVLLHNIEGQLLIANRSLQEGNISVADIHLQSISRKCDDFRSYLTGEPVSMSTIRPEELAEFAIDTVSEEIDTADIVVKKYVDLGLPPLMGHLFLLRHAV